MFFEKLAYLTRKFVSLLVFDDFARFFVYFLKKASFSKSIKFDANFGPLSTPPHVRQDFGPNRLDFVLEKAKFEPFEFLGFWGLQK